MATVLVGAVLFGMIAFIVKGMIRDKRKGISLQCGGSCKSCCGCAAAQGQSHIEKK